MNFKLTIVAVTLAGLLSPLAAGQSLQPLQQPVDSNKRAPAASRSTWNDRLYQRIETSRRATDIENKTVHFGDVNPGSLTPGTRSTANSLLSGKQAHFNNVNLSDVDLKTLNGFSDISMKTLPQQNFTAKRATLPDKVPPQEQLGHTRTRAPITARQIRPFTPGGEEELKQQFHDIPPPQGPQQVQPSKSSGK